MELVTFESKTYKDLVEKIDRIAQFVVKKESAAPPDSSKEDSIDNGWLDNDQTADMSKNYCVTVSEPRK